MNRRNRCVIQAGTVTREIPAPAGGVVIETFVPWKMVLRGVRRRIITPLGQVEEFRGHTKAGAAQEAPLLRFIGLAHHWQRLLDTGHRRGLRDIAEEEGIDLGRASRIMRLVQLSPQVVEAAIGGDTTVGLSDLLQGFDDRWEVQQSIVKAAGGVPAGKDNRRAWAM